MLAGACAGIFGRLVFDNPINFALTAAILIFFILLVTFGLELDRRLIHWLRTRVRIERQKIPTLAVINEIDWNDLVSEIIGWTRFTPQDWVENAKRIGIGRTMTTKISHRMISSNIVINPYAGVLPETDTVNLSNLEAILEYVSEGGMFVNISDVPGYWMFDKNLRRTVDATPNIYSTFTDPRNGTIQLASARPFELTPFLNRLSVRILNNSISGIIYESHSSFPIPSTIPTSVDRSAVVEKNVTPILEFRIGDQRYSPLFTVNFGSGVFLFCTFHLTMEGADTIEYLLRVIFEVYRGLENSVN